MSYFWKMCLWSQNKFRSQWPIFHGPVISLLLSFALKNILVLLAKLNSGELRCPATALINDFGMSRPGIEPVTSRSPERTLYRLSYWGRWIHVWRNLNSTMLWFLFLWFRSIMIIEPWHDKNNKMSVRPAKTQIHPVWSESSLSAWRKLGSLAAH